MLINFFIYTLTESIIFNHNLSNQLFYYINTAKNNYPEEGGEEACLSTFDN